MKKTLLFLLLPFAMEAQVLPATMPVASQVPVITSGNATDTSVEFFWNGVANAATYEVSYQTDFGANASNVVVGNQRRYPLHGLRSGSAVNFTVTPYDHSGHAMTSASIAYLARAGECSSSVVPPTVLNGVTVTATWTGVVDTYPSAFTSCGVTTPPNSLWLGISGNFSYTMTFSEPVNNLVIALTASGQTFDEFFFFDTNGGVPSIAMANSCFSVVTGNQIATGLNSTYEGGGGGGIFTIQAPANFTSMTITGPGGNAGSLISICSNSVTPVNCNVSFAPTLSLTSLNATCPETTVNLGAITAGNLPTTTGVSMTWHTATPVSAANQVTGNLGSQPAGVTYYAAFFDSVNNCYGSPSTVTTTTSAIMPTFTQVAPICAGQTLTALPTMSNNSVVGTWAPAPNNNATTTYTFTPTTGCATTTTMTINVIPTVNPVFDTVEPVCIGDVILDLPTLSNNGITGTWSPPLNNMATTSYTFTPTSGQCATPATLEIPVKPKPVVTIGQECVGQAFILTATTDAASAAFEWYKGEGFQFQVGSEASLTIDTAGIYHVAVVAGNGCETDASITVDDITCKIQKGISPNGDNFNEYFDLSNLNVAKLKIYNRYGMLVYDKTNYTNQWDGKTNDGDQLPDATYYYLIELNSGQSKTGWIYINSKS